MKMKYIALILIVIGISGLFILNLYNNLEQQRQENERLTELSTPKTLTLSSNAIHIISVHTDYPVCKDNSYQNAPDELSAIGIVDFSQIKPDDFSSLSPYGTKLKYNPGQYIDLQYKVGMTFTVDGSTPNAVGIDSMYVQKVRRISNGFTDNSDKFSFSFGGVSPTESHVLRASIILVNEYDHITSNFVDVTYTIPKLC